MIRGRRKCKLYPKSTISGDQINSPKRKDAKVSEFKEELVSSKRGDYANNKLNRNKRDTKLLEASSPTIKDFFKPKINLHQEKGEFYFDGLLNEKLKISYSNVHSVYPELEVNSNICETSLISLSQNVTTQNQLTPPKPVTPHRIVCIPPEKNKSEQPEVYMKDINRESRNKKKENDSKKAVQLHILDSKKPVLNSTTNPSARQNTNNNKKIKNIDCKNETNKLTNYFPVRRSARKTNKEVQQELQHSYEKAILEQCEDGLEIKVFENKGRGIVSVKPFFKNQFVLEYVGDLISIAEANKREIIYAREENTGCFMYYFKYKGQQYCIDATEESGKLGRLVNHSRNGNLITKTVSVKGEPHLILVAKNDIKAGVELTYDYGDRSKESLAHHPWLAF